MTVKTITPPATEPVTLTEVKRHLGLSSSATDHDSRLTDLITEGRSKVEIGTGQRLITQTVSYLFEGLSRIIKLPVMPIITLDSFTYYDQNDTQQNMDSSLYYSDFDSFPPKLVLKSEYVWPSVKIGRPNPCEIQLSCGYGAAASDVPKGLKSAILLYIEIMFDEPDTKAQEAIQTCINKAVGQYKFNWF